MLPGRTIEAVKRRAHLLHLHKSGRRFPWRSLNEDFFRVPNLLSSYWAGFIAADGCIVTDPRHELRIGIHKRDVDHLRRFCADTGYNGNLRTDSKDISHVCICCAGIWIKDLSRVFNVGPRKTFTLLPPPLSGEMALAYSVGVIDGDGCWSTDSQVSGRRLILVVVGTEALLRWLIELWKDSGASIGEPRISFRRNIWRLALHKSKAEEVARLLLAVETPKLDRKWRVARREADGQEVQKKRI